jgi:hypothetical protein
MAEKKFYTFKFEAAPVTMLYIDAAKPRAADFGHGKKGDPVYQAQIGIKPDHPELKALKAKMIECAKDMLGTIEGVHWPVRDGTEMADEAHKRGKDRGRCRGLVVLKAASPQEYPPNLVLIENGQAVQVEEAMRSQVASKFYPGVEGSIEVNFKAYDGNGSNIPKTVVAYLRSVVSLNRGKNLGSSSAARFGAFAKNIGVVSQQDVTEGLDEEVGSNGIPF